MISAVERIIAGLSYIQWHFSSCREAWKFINPFTADCTDICYHQGKDTEITPNTQNCHLQPKYVTGSGKTGTNAPKMKIELLSFLYSPCHLLQNDGLL
jgi:hypothetical protein